MFLVWGKCNLIVSSCVTSVMPKYHKGAFTSQWRHSVRDGISNHQPRECLLNRLFRHKWKKTKLRVTGLCAGNLPVTVEFPAQRTRNAENVSIWWRHHAREGRQPGIITRRYQTWELLFLLKGIHDTGVNTEEIHLECGKFCVQGPLLLAWVIFYPSIDE